MARDKVGIFYYPSMVSEGATLKKAILLFDELHFIDRPSFTLRNYGTIAVASPLRQYEQSFRDNGVPLYVHKPNDGPVMGEFLEEVQSDINDIEFLQHFQRGLEESTIFRDHQIAPGNYGEVGNQDDLAKALISVDLSRNQQHATPMDLFCDDKVQHFKCSTEQERTKALVTHALTCSTMINFALTVSERQGFTPLADSAVYQKLLGAKYARAVKMLGAAGVKVEVADLSLAILDELLPAERLGELTFGDVVKYRKETAKAREAFLEHLAALQAKQAAITDGNYAAAIQNIVTSEIIPEARRFKSDIERTYENLFGKLVTSTVAYLAGGSALQIFGDVSWSNLLHLSGLAGAAILKAATEARREVRAAHRDCAISYVLGLDK